MQKDFLAITDMTREEIMKTFELTKVLKEEVNKGIPHHRLDGQSLAMIFAKPSARTRVSFETGMFQLGGHALYLSPNDIGIGKREAVKDIAQVLSRYNNGIMARLFEHRHMEELAEFASVPVINGLTDFNHPCQVMADIFTVLEHRGNLNELKVTFVGDGNNVANSWINLASRIPMHFVIASPSGYDPDPTILEKAREAGISEIEVLGDPKEAVADTDVIYTDVWASMGQEDEAEERRKAFMPFQVNSELLSQAKEDCYVMHCLPAHRGDEITNVVIDGPHSIVFDEAENRMHVQKAIMVQLMEK
ncbi:MAG: ornithine carbamoyltransferase [Candidatus Marinimicrobia bacterium]|nr:ornithine carbamoyltransferase [Candidatus Neomarinimicrobiota bacterium]MCF7829501.1 ornithine carbamoyltransferase [Candidatus Neomarinimicrobiota bacterium]MCF7880101.1 ornithine carbamoyltransferase [Candidatus Neomarinimicrobiota bacterium]